MTRTFSLGSRLAAMLALGCSRANGADLFTAISSGNVDELTLILKNNPGLVHSLEQSGRSPLYTEVQYGYHSLEMARALLAAGADATWHDQYGEQAIHQAATFSTPEMLALLVSHGANVNSVTTLTADSPLICAARLGKDANVQWLLNSGADVSHVNLTGDTALTGAAAAKGDHAEMVGILISSGADLNKANNVGYSPLRIAAISQNRHCAQRMIKGGAHWDIFAATALGEVAVVKELVAENPRSVNEHSEKEDTRTPLHFAAVYGETAIAELLLEHGAAVNATSNVYDSGATALFYAVQHYHTDLVALLVRHGARLDLKGRDSSGPQTPLELAQKSGYSDIVAILEEASRGTSAFH